jgi:Xaa-Pro dipeptidase
VKRAVDAAQALVRPGVDVAELDDVTIAVMEEGGLGKARVHRTGYGLGLGYPPSWLEELQIVRGYPFVLEEGMIFSLEPPASLPEEGFGIKLIDDILVTPDGSQTMSRLGRDIIVVS